jgi:hypothetical protein
MSRPFLVGEGPSPTFVGHPRVRPLFGRPTRVLCDVVGLQPATVNERVRAASSPLRADVLRYIWLRSCARLENLCAGAWDLREAEIRSLSLAHDAGMLRANIIVLGRRAARAFGVRDWPFYETRHYHLSCTRLVVLPHPSGLNRLYNSPDVRDRASVVLRDFFSLRSIKK